MFKYLIRIRVDTWIQNLLEKFGLVIGCELQGFSTTDEDFVVPLAPFKAIFIGRIKDFRK